MPEVHLPLTRLRAQHPVSEWLPQSLMLFNQARSACCSPQVVLARCAVLQKMRRSKEAVEEGKWAVQLGEVGIISLPPRPWASCLVAPSHGGAGMMLFACLGGSRGFCAAPCRPLLGAQLRPKFSGI